MTETTIALSTGSQIPLYLLLVVAGAAVVFLIYYFYHRRKEGEWQERLKEELKRNNELTLEEIRLQERLTSLQDKLAGEKERQEQQLQEQQASFNRQMAAMEAQFTALSEEITKRRSEELTSSNKRNMDALLTPLKETIEKMDKAFQANKQSSAEQSGELKEAIANLMARAEEVGDKADNLSQALRHESKMQGNWGELVLERLLEMEDLKKGVHYDTQATLRDERNAHHRPDVILHYPDGKDLIIDAKVSLTAYTNYFNADDEALKETYKKQHLRSVEAHIKELSQKKYYKYVEKPREALEYVVMFMPIEGAMEMALEEKPELWRDAIDQGVFLANDRNLLAILRIISIVWRQYDQERNVDEIVKQAELLVKRVADFVDDFAQIQSRINQLQTTYDQAERRLSGRQGLIGSAKRIVNLGVKNTSSKALPEADEH